VSSDDLSRDGGGRANVLVLCDGSDSGVDDGDPGTTPDAPASILHEDKVHYPSAAEIYRDGVHTTMLDEGAMDLSDPMLRQWRQRISA